MAAYMSFNMFVSNYHHDVGNYMNFFRTDFDTDQKILYSVNLQIVAMYNEIGNHGVSQSMFLENQ